MRQRVNDATNEERHTASMPNPTTQYLWEPRRLKRGRMGDREKLAYVAYQMETSLRPFSGGILAVR